MRAWSKRITIPTSGSDVEINRSEADAEAAESEDQQAR